MKRSEHFRIALLLGLLSFIGGFTVYLVVDDLLGISVNDLKEQFGLPFVSVALLGGLQVGLLSFILAWIGLALGASIGLDAPIFRRFIYGKDNREAARFSPRYAAFGAIGAVVGSLLLMLLDRYAFMPFLSIPKGMDEPAVWWKGVLTMFYGGIVEEVQVRLFLMTLIAWALLKMSSSNYKDAAAAKFYWTAIIASAIIFGLLHLPATQQAFEVVTPLLVVRAIVLNSLLGIFFGYLFWKKGLEYAILSHMVADVCLHAVFVHLF